MRLLGNILWFILGGWWSFLLYAFLGVIFCITIIGIPIGKSLFQYAKLMAFPFGKVIMKETEIKGKENVAAVRRVGGTIANIIWLPFGIVTFIGSIGAMIVCFLSIIFIPVGVALAKSCTFLLWPVGAKVVTKEEAETIRMTNAMKNAMGGANVAGMNPTASYVMPAEMEQGSMAQPAMEQAAMQQATAAQAVNMQSAPAQPNQTLENLKAGSSQMFDNLKETGGKAANAIAETGGKAATVIAETSAEGMAALKSRQKTVTEQVLAGEQTVTMEEMLVQMEVKLYHNQIMAWIMPFLEYITAFVAVLAVIVGIFRYRHLSVANMMLQAIGIKSVSFGFIGVIRGMLYGITSMAPLFLIAAVLGMIKRSHIYVLVLLGVELLAHILSACLGSGFDFWAILCYVGIILWYVLVIMKKTDMSTVLSKGQAEMAKLQKNVQGNAGSNTQNNLQNNVQTGQKCFCNQCGAECSENVSFCPKCGNKLK